MAAALAILLGSVILLGLAAGRRRLRAGVRAGRIRLPALTLGSVWRVERAAAIAVVELTLPSRCTHRPPRVRAQDRRPQYSSSTARSFPARPRVRNLDRARRLFLDRRGYTKEDIGRSPRGSRSASSRSRCPWASSSAASRRACLVTSLAGYACAVSAFPPSYASIAVVRFFDGAFSVGLWVSCETILLSRADKKNKAFITSLYAIAPPAAT